MFNIVPRPLNWCRWTRLFQLDRSCAATRGCKLEAVTLWKEVVFLPHFYPWCGKDFENMAQLSSLISIVQTSQKTFISKRDQGQRSGYESGDQLDGNTCKVRIFCLIGPVEHWKNTTRSSEFTPHFKDECGGRRRNRQNKSKVIMYSAALHSCLRYLLAAFALHFSPGGWYWSAQRWVILHASNLKGSTLCPFSDLYLSPLTPVEPCKIKEKKKNQPLWGKQHIYSLLSKMLILACYWCTVGPSTQRTAQTSRGCRCHTQLQKQLNYLSAPFWKELRVRSKIKPPTWWQHLTELKTSGNMK